MKRRPRIMLKLGVFLLLVLAGGAIVNVAVAWGCNWFPGRVMGGAKIVLEADAAEWPKDVPNGFPPPQLVHVIERIGVSERLFSCVVEHENTNPRWPHTSVADSRMQDQYAAGLPFRAFERTNQWSIFKNGEWEIDGWDVPMWCVDRGIDEFDRIPFRPLWPGFAINTIFYAAILWLLWIAPGKIRQFVRARGHRCPACGFIIAPNTCANGLCSECGHKLPWITGKVESRKVES